MVRMVYLERPQCHVFFRDSLLNHDTADANFGCSDKVRYFSLEICEQKDVRNIENKKHLTKLIFRRKNKKVFLLTVDDIFRNLLKSEAILSRDFDDFLEF